jgi:hypothetical protein
MIKRPYAELRVQFQLPYWQKARIVPFREADPVLVEDVDRKEDMELGGEDLTHVLVGGVCRIGRQTVGPLEIGAQPCTTLRRYQGLHGLLASIFHLPKERTSSVRIGLRFNRARGGDFSTGTKGIFAPAPTKIMNAD